MERSHAGLVPEVARLQAGLAAKTAELHAAHQRLRRAYQQIDQDRDAAQRLQSSLRPRALPDVTPARLGLHLHSCGRPGCDFHDAFRLDDRHVAFLVGDALGAGVTASLLGMFVRWQLADGKKANAPHLALAQLNRALLDLALPETPLLALLLGTLDLQDGTLRFARAGHPAPLLVPRSGAIEFIPGGGCLLGLAPAEFALTSCVLQPGDKFLVCSDGLVPADQAAEARQRLLGAAARYRAQPVAEFVDHLARELIEQAGPGDDMTVLGVEWGGESCQPGSQG